MYKNEWKEHKFQRQEKSKKVSFTKTVKKVTNVDDTDVNKILVSKKEPYGTKNSFKYFTGYNDNDVIRLLSVRLPRMTDYVRKFDENATISFKANDKQVLKNYNKIWEKVEKLLEIEFESKPVYCNDGKCITTKIKIYAGSMITNIHNKKVPRDKFFDILLVFSFFLQEYFICFFHILFFYFYLLQIGFCIYFLQALSIFLYCFHNNLSLYIVLHLCFFL